MPALAARAGRPIEVAVIASRSRRDADLLGAEFTTDVLSLTRRDDVDVVVELMGGDGLALELVSSSLAAGRATVTANKAILAGHGNRLFDLAEQYRAPLGIGNSFCNRRQTRHVFVAHRAIAEL